jgi:hypothetical protein
MNQNKDYAQQAVWQNGGFGAFLEGKVLNQSSGIFSNFGAEKPPLRQAAGTLCITFEQQKTKKTENLLPNTINWYICKNY